MCPLTPSPYPHSKHNREGDQARRAGRPAHCHGPLPLWASLSWSVGQANIGCCDRECLPLPIFQACKDMREAMDEDGTKKLLFKGRDCLPGAAKHYYNDYIN